jgi:hypothetical protein
MIISLINRSKKILDHEAQQAIRAINRQIAEDFEPYWSFGAKLRLEGAIGKRANADELSDMRGDAVLYLIDKADENDALGWHDRNYRDIPYGFVFLELCAANNENWTVTLSHEALELVGDPAANLLVQGPCPSDKSRQVFHMFEMCDAVQAEKYKIDQIEVSNFVLPSYFSPGEQDGRRNDFLGTKYGRGKSLESFGMNPGGYVNYFDPKDEKWYSPTRPGDKVALARQAAKRKVHAGRGYRRQHPASTKT